MFYHLKVVAIVVLCPTQPRSRQKLQGMAPALSLFAGTCGGAVAHHVCHDAMPPRAEQSQG